MDRLVKADVKEVNVVFSRGHKCSTTFRLTNLMHTMAVAVSVNTTNPSLLSLTHPFAILPPLATASFTLLVSKPSHHPPLSTPPDNVLVRSSMLPTGKADLRRLFSKSGPHIFKDATIPISFVGPHVIEFLLSSSFPRTLETASVLSKAILWCDDSQLTRLLAPAAMAGNSYVVSSLLDAGADVNDCESVMLLAVKSGDIDTVRVLIHSGCHKHDQLLHAAASANRVDVMEVVCMGYVDMDVNSIDSQGQTALHIAATHGYVQVLEFLITLQSDPDIADYNGWTALHCASDIGHLESVQFLLNCSTFVKYAPTKAGKTAFSLAVEKGHTDLYDMLHLGDVLHRAARKGDVDEMNKCLSDGAKVNTKDQNGWTALHKASFKGHIECVKVLLNHGAHVGLVDAAGYTPLHLAVESGHAQVAMLLIGHGAKAHIKSLALPFDLDSFKNNYPTFTAPVRHMIERA